jgi:uncharacterized UPF0160 family protein
METKKPELILTHDGVAHAGEVFAIAHIRKFFEATIPVLRTRDAKEVESAKNNKSVWVIDVGGEYDEEMRNFDHHQLSKTTQHMGPWGMIAKLLPMHLPEGLLEHVESSELSLGNPQAHTAWGHWHQWGKFKVSLPRMIHLSCPPPGAEAMYGLHFQHLLFGAGKLLDGDDSVLRYHCAHEALKRKKAYKYSRKRMFSMQPIGPVLVLEQYELAAIEVINKKFPYVRAIVYPCDGSWCARAIPNRWQKTDTLRVTFKSDTPDPDITFVHAEGFLVRGNTQEAVMKFVTAAL